MRSHLTPTGLTAGFQGGIALADGMIHQQDIRRPLRISRNIPPERVIAALRIAVGAPTLPSRRRVKALQLIATDADWTHGQGPELRGPAEALLMLVAGRKRRRRRMRRTRTATLAPKLTSAFRSPHAAHT